MRSDEMVCTGWLAQASLLPFHTSLTTSRKPRLGLAESARTLAPRAGIHTSRITSKTNPTPVLSSPPQHTTKASEWKALHTFPTTSRKPRRGLAESARTPAPPVGIHTSRITSKTNPTPELSSPPQHTTKAVLPFHTSRIMSNKPRPGTPP